METVTPDGSVQPADEIPYTVVSCDTHAGPSLERTLRAYCPQKYLEQFDEYTRLQRVHLGPEYCFGSEEKYAYTVNCEGHDDPHARLRDMDSAGVAGAVIFGGGQNHEAVPFLGLGFDSGSPATARELRAVGEGIWNEWLADYVATDPGRLLGVMQVPLWDIDYAVKEIARYAERGLKAINFPSPRSDFPTYNDPIYEPLWQICEERNIPLTSHSGGGERPLGADGPGGLGITLAEGQWLGRRHLTQLIFGGVFERHPDLRIVLTEQRVAWVPYTLEEFDSIYRADLVDPSWRALWPQLPSAYFHQHCYIGGSFLAPFEIALRHEVGLRNLMWGDDYPHVEGTWPYTRLSLRFTFADVPPAEARLILGENAIDVYGFDRQALQQAAARVGPLPSELSVAVDPSEIPAHPALAFRREGPYS